MLGLARTARQELGEYLQRGEGQRPTGSIFPHATVIGHEKGWTRVDNRLIEELKEYTGAYSFH